MKRWLHPLQRMQGNVKILGLAIANGLVSLAGCIFCQEERVFEISMGTGAMVIGLASVIIGTSLFQKHDRYSEQQLRF